MIRKVMSGGQTGADRGALDAAIKLGIPHGGWLPAGRKTENGPLPESYQLNELATESYPERTEKNVLDSDGTLILSHGLLTGGSHLTRNLAKKHQKPHLHVDLEQMVGLRASQAAYGWVRAHRIEVLNVAGPRASENPKIYFDTFSVIEGLIALCLVDSGIESGHSVGNVLTVPDERSPIPKTVDEAVDSVLRVLDKESMGALANRSVNQLALLNSTAGELIKVEFKLPSGNDDLLNSCRRLSGDSGMDPEGAAIFILKAVWASVRQTRH